jgi:hypothetical protein
MNGLSSLVARLESSALRLPVAGKEKRQERIAPAVHLPLKIACLPFAAKTTAG